MTDDEREESPKHLLRRWRRRCQSAALAHYRAARHYDGCFFWLGSTLIVVSTVAAVLAGRPMFGVPVGELDTLALLISAATVSLASVQVFRNDAARADRHRRTAATYSAIKRDIEHIASTKDRDCSYDSELRLLRLRLRVVAEESPGVPGGIWKKVDADAPSRSAEL
jgi:hypothetical protein